MFSVPTHLKALKILALSKKGYQTQRLNGYILRKRVKFKVWLQGSGLKVLLFNPSAVFLE